MTAGEANAESPAPQVTAALRRHGALLAAIALCALHFASFDFRNLPIVTDARYYLYFAWQITEGAVPHLDMFDNKTQLTSYVGALLYALGDGLGFDPLLTIRVGYLAATAFAGVLSFFVFRRLGGGSSVCGLLGALAWCSFGLLGELAALGNLPKLWMGVAALAMALLVDRRHWFLAGIAGALAFMDWQIGVIVWLSAFVSALWLDRDRGWRPVLEVAAGGAAGLAPFVLYYAATGALAAAYDQVIAAAFFRGSAVAQVSTLTRRLTSLTGAAHTGGPQEWLFYLSGLGVPVVLLWLRSRREVALLLPLVFYHFGVIAFSLVDFQWYGDFFLVLQSAAFFLAALWAGAYLALTSLLPGTPRARAAAGITACLIATAMARPGPLRPEIELGRVKPPHTGATLADQRAVADAMSQQIGDRPVAFLEHSEMLFLMRKRNQLPVIFWNRPTWSTHRRAEEEISATAQRVIAAAHADFVVVPQPRTRRYPIPGTDAIGVKLVDYSRALEGYTVKTFSSAGNRFELEVGVREVGVRTETAGPGDSSSLDSDRVDQLRALGYVEAGEALPEGAATGLLQHDRERAVAGLTLYTDATACETHLVDMAGEFLHSWAGTSCYRWGNSVLLSDGDLLVIARERQGESQQESDAARSLLRLAWNGELRWRVQLPVHHDVEWTPNDQILVLSHALRELPSLSQDMPVRDNVLSLLTASGESLEELSLWDAIAAAEEPLALQTVRPRRVVGSPEIDLFHSNAIEWMRQPDLVGSHPIYREDSVLVCMRNQDLLLLLDWSERRVIWSWGPGELSGPHDATLLPNGNILAFDNGLSRDWSRVIELDPRTKQIVWQYRAPNRRDFYTRSRGSSQRLDNGNTLVAESEKGRITERTPEGEVVWDFLNPSLSEEREPGVVVRARRLAGLDFEEVVRRVEAGEPLPLSD